MEKKTLYIIVGCVLGILVAIPAIIPYYILIISFGPHGEENGCSSLLCTYDLSFKIAESNALRSLESRIELTESLAFLRYLSYLPLFLVSIFLGVAISLKKFKRNYKDDYRNPPYGVLYTICYLIFLAFAFFYTLLYIIPYLPGQFIHDPLYAIVLLITIAIPPIITVFSIASISGLWKGKRSAKHTSIVLVSIIFIFHVLGFINYINTRAIPDWIIYIMRFTPGGLNSIVYPILSLLVLYELIFNKKVKAYFSNQKITQSTKV